MIYKKCTVCKEQKNLNDFYNSKRSKDGKTYRCKVCDGVARQRNRDKNTKGTKLGYRRRQLKFNYGLTLEDYDDMLKSQNYRCAICNTDNPLGEGKVMTTRTFSFSVDHCHNTGKIRQLLCNSCNRGLGFFRDSPEIMQSAVNYLLKHKTLTTR